MMTFDFYVHGLWILGSLTMFAGAMIAGNVEFIEGSTPLSFGLSVLIALLLILFSGVCWVSASINAKQEQK